MEYLNITTPLFGSDFEMFKGIVNQGIDSHLEGFTSSKCAIKGSRLHLNIAQSEIPILVRRLEELETEEADEWARDILET